MRRSWLRWIGLLLIALGGWVLCFVPQVPTAIGEGCTAEIRIDNNPESDEDYRRVEDSCTGELLFEGSLDAAQRYRSQVEDALPVRVLLASGLAAITGGVALFVVGNRSVPAPEATAKAKAYRALRWGVAGFVVFFIGSVWLGDQLYRAGYLSYEADLGPYLNAFLLVPSAVALISAVLGFTYRPRG